MRIDKSGPGRFYLTSLAMIVLFAGILIWRAHYGFCQSDESFYISTAGRFASGDLVFVDEWHPTQLSSLITMPLYAIYTAIYHGTDGIILYFRVLYVLFTAIEACAVCRLLYDGSGESRKAQLKALIPAIFLMLYCHLNIATLSYYTLSFHFFILAFVIAYAGSSSAIKMIPGGICFALSVLSLPSLAVGYVIVTLILLCVCIGVKKIRKPLMFFNLGILITLAGFLIYIYASGNSIAGLLANLPYIMSDEEHLRGYVESFKVFFNAISDVFGKIYYLSIVLVILAMVSYVNLKEKRLEKTPNAYTKHLILMADLLLFIYFAILSGFHVGFINTAFALFVFPLFFLTVKKDWFIFLTMFMGGLAVSMTYTFSSFCDLYVLSIGHGISAFGGILLLLDYKYEEKGSISGYKGLKKAEIAALSAVLAVFLMMTMILRISYVYRDDRLQNLGSRLSAGPAAHLYTSAPHKEQYDSLLESIEKYRDAGEDILFTKLLPWGYTASGLSVNAPDSWRNQISSARLMQYYRAHDMKLPDIVVVLDADAASYESSFDLDGDPAPNQNEFEGEFADILRSDYKENKEEHCIVYTMQN